MTERHILLLMSGSIACAKAATLISTWVKRGDRVRVACTAAARHFIGNATLEGLSGEPVFDNTFGAGRNMEHIAWAQWADLVVICPATSNLINKIAGGIADDAVTTLWQGAWGRNLPLFVVPAMNTSMWRYPATVENVARLRDWGVHVLPAADGDLACGERGAGRLLEPEQILQTIDDLLEPGSAPCRTGKVLITGGGTREPIDQVRFIGNQSSGRTAAALADRLGRMGFEVTWLGADGAVRPQACRRQIGFSSFADLRDALTEVLGRERFDMVIHAAAVSDFSVQSESAGAAKERAAKLPSDRELVLRLQPNPKLLNRIRDFSNNPDVVVVGFKLTVGANGDERRAAVERVFERGAVDYVVENDLQEMQAGERRFRLFTHEGSGTAGACKELGNLAELAPALAGLLPEPGREEAAS